MSRCWDQERFEFETYGFAVLDSVLDAETSSRLASRIDFLDEQRGIDYTHDGAFARHISSVYADDDELMALIDHPDVLGFIESALGSEIIPGSSNARNRSARRPPSAVSQRYSEPAAAPGALGNGQRGLDDRWVHRGEWCNSIRTRQPSRCVGNPSLSM